MKKRNIALVILLISIVILAKKWNELEKHLTMERGGPIIFVTFSDKYDTEPSHLITIFDSGEIEVVQGIAEIKDVRKKEDFVKIKAISNLSVSEEEVSEFIFLADKLTKAQKKEGIEPPEVETSGPSYMRIVYQDNEFETWNMAVHPEMREYFGITSKWEEYDDNTYDIAKKFLIKIWNWVEK